MKIYDLILKMSMNMKNEHDHNIDRCPTLFEIVTFFLHLPRHLIGTNSDIPLVGFIQWNTKHNQVLVWKILNS